MTPATVRLLIGEDDEIVALDMQQQLRELGYQVNILAGTPREVLSLASDLKPDVVILDLNIQGDMHGFEVARKLHENYDVPIVFVSAYGKDIIDHDSSIPRPYRYVTKPVDIAELNKAIRSLLGESEGR